MKHLLWQCIQIYRTETLKPDNEFSDLQKTSLLEKMDVAELNYNSINPKRIHKMNMAFVKFDKEFIEYGGDYGRLNEAVTDVYNQAIPQIAKAKEFMNKSKRLQKLINKVRK